VEAITDVLPAPDTDGIIHIGKGGRGCRHCGKIETHYGITPASPAARRPSPIR